MQGLVQGVGFRPFIYQIAHRYQIKGCVYNITEGVIIKVEGDSENISRFISEIKNNHPQAAEIVSISLEDARYEGYDEFQIKKSNDSSNLVSEISPDIATCEDCLEDLKQQKHRVNYPFINCTNCGPRFSIVKDFPYDRVNTTMDEFPMCEKCESEYKEILDRRFHAQPVACNDCGPKYTLHYPEKKIEIIEEILVELKRILEEGGIISIKGLGGFHIMCDATNEKAVERLRNSKKREGKPFAVMFSGIDAIQKFAYVSDIEEKSLLSWKRPINLLKAKKNKLAESVCLGFDTIGAFLPYMPIHYLLFEKLDIDALVLTSGNISEEPIITDNEDALKILARISDAVLTYNREIYNRTDDSVIKIINDSEQVLRRSRGYAPNPVYLKNKTEGIFAAGAELVNCFCIGKGNQAILSQHIGDLKNYETFDFYKKAFKTFKKVFRFEPQLVVTDLHPDYLSTHFGEELNKEAIKVQHHHAHIASCMVENELYEPVIGLSFDGTGLGDDKTIWGSEFLIADLDGYERKFHFEYIELPGGDKATYEPWRIAVSNLYRIYGKEFLDFKLDFLKNIPNSQVSLILHAIDKKINCPASCSAGRLFDAVSALLNVCTLSSFHAEAPMRLEAIASEEIKGFYDFEIKNYVSFKPMIQQIISDLRDGIKKEVISSKFHNTVVEAIFKVTNKIKIETGINKIALSGGTFQNRYLLEKLETMFSKSGYEVFTQNKIPCNDGGIALGQLAIAANMFKV